MFSDPLTLKYLLLTLLAIWGVLAIVASRGRYTAYLLGLGVFLAIAYLALGSGFSIRLPHVHGKMEVIVYTIHNDRVHALAHPLEQPGEPIHIAFSIDPDTERGRRMRRSFFDAVRAREGKRRETRIIIDMRGYMAEHGTREHETTPALAPKGQ